MEILAEMGASPYIGSTLPNLQPLPNYLLHCYSSVSTSPPRNDLFSRFQTVDGAGISAMRGVGR